MHLVPVYEYSTYTNNNSQFAHSIHVHTHSRDFATAVLVEFVAACLASEAIKKKLVAKITVS